MTLKKARKRLQKVEGLLTDVRDRCAKAETEVHELLDRAKAAISDALIRIETRAEKKPPANASELSQTPPAESVKARPSKSARKEQAGGKKKESDANGRKALRRTA